LFAAMTLRGRGGSVAGTAPAGSANAFPPAEAHIDGAFATPRSPKTLTLASCPAAWPSPPPLHIYRFMHSSGVVRSLLLSKTDETLRTSRRWCSCGLLDTGAHGRPLLHRHRHGCLPYPRCPFCTADEDLLNLLIRCRASRPFWLP
jgi:hypothetical protein